MRRVKQKCVRGLPSFDNESAIRQAHADYVASGKTLSDHFGPEAGNWGHRFNRYGLKYKSRHRVHNNPTPTLYSVMVKYIIHAESVDDAINQVSMCLDPDGPLFERPRREDVRHLVEQRVTE